MALTAAGVLAFTAFERERGSLPDPIAVGAAPAGSADGSEVAFREVEPRTFDPLDGSAPGGGEPPDELEPPPGPAGEEADLQGAPATADGSSPSDPPVGGGSDGGAAPTTPPDTSPTTVGVEAGARVNRPPATDLPDGSATTLPTVTLPPTTTPPVPSVPPLITSVTELIDDLLGIDLTGSGT